LTKQRESIKFKLRLFGSSGVLLMIALRTVEE